MITWTYVTSGTNNATISLSDCHAPSNCPHTGGCERCSEEYVDSYTYVTDTALSCPEMPECEEEPKKVCRKIYGRNKRRVKAPQRMSFNHHSPPGGWGFFKG